MTALRDVRHRVEHVDTDAAGVMHFARYTSLLESAVLDNLEHLGVGVRSLQRTGLELTIMQLRMDYFAPARFFDDLVIRLKLERVGGASFVLGGAIHGTRVAPDTLLATGRLAFCVVAHDGSGLVGLPGELRRTLGECMDGETDDDAA